MSEGLPRRLYDMMWLQEACGDTALSEGSMVDDTTATALTCFLAGIAGAVAAAAVYREKTNPLRFRIVVTGFCVLDGIARALEGVLMLTVSPPRGPEGYIGGKLPSNSGKLLMYWLPQLLRLAGALMLCVLSNQVLLIVAQGAPEGIFTAGPYISYLNGFTALFVALVAFAFCSGTRDLLFVNFVVAGMIAYSVVVLAMRGKIMKCRGLALIVVGLWVRWSLEDECGDLGYMNCFRDCPLPYWNKDRFGLLFNHTATAYLFEAAGLLLFAWSVKEYPDFTNEGGLEEDLPKPKPQKEPDFFMPAQTRGCTARSCTAGCAVQ